MLPPLSIPAPNALPAAQCCIDLKANQLVFGSCDARLPFLSEAEIPTDFSRHVDEVSEEEAKKNMDAGVGELGGGHGQGEGARGGHYGAHALRCTGVQPSRRVMSTVAITRLHGCAVAPDPAPCPFLLPFCCSHKLQVLTLLCN